MTGPPRTLDVSQAYQQAILLAQQGRLGEAEELCRRIVAAYPNQFDALQLLSDLNQRAGRLTEAVVFARKALNQRPRAIPAIKILGDALVGLGRVDEAIAQYNKALTLDPRHFGLLNNLGVALRSESRFEEALPFCERAIASKPDEPGAENNLGKCLMELQRPKPAIEHFQRALHLAPDYAVARYNEGTAHLAIGDYQTGWEKYEARWAMPEVNAWRYPGAAPLWRGGTELAGKTILLSAEQGFGDTVQFCRYAPLVAERGARVLLMVPASLVSVMETLAGPSGVFAQGTELPAHDFYCPLMNLPHVFDTRIETIPDRVPYVTADPAKAATWLQRLATLPGRRIGVVWFGSARWGRSAINNPDRRRSLALMQMAPLAEIAGASFVSLQLGTPVWGADPAPPGLVLHDWTAEIKDFSDTAALIDGLDLVITVDTSTVHLAGALGKPVWLMNRFDTCWRWLLDRDDSPWYPTLRQFRQPKPGDWDSVVASVAAALTAFVRD